MSGYEEIDLPTTLKVVAVCVFATVSVKLGAQSFDYHVPTFAATFLGAVAGAYTLRQCHRRKVARQEEPSTVQSDQDVAVRTKPDLDDKQHSVSRYSRPTLTFLAFILALWLVLHGCIRILFQELGVDLPVLASGALASLLLATHYVRQVKRERQSQSGKQLPGQSNNGDAQ